MTDREGLVKYVCGRLQERLPKVIEHEIALLVDLTEAEMDKFFDAASAAVSDVFQRPDA